MDTVYVTDVLPQMDTPITGGNPTVDTDRVKAPVVGAGPTDLGAWTHTHTLPQD